MQNQSNLENLGEKMAEAMASVTEMAKKVGKAVNEAMPAMFGSAKLYRHKETKHHASKRGFRHTTGKGFRQSKKLIPTNHERVVMERIKKDPDYGVYLRALKGQR